MYKHNFVSTPQMLILLNRSHCKTCPLPTIQSCVFVLFATDKHARSYCRQCAHFTTGTNEQNQHFAVLRQKVCLYIHEVVLQRGLPSLDCKLERFVTKSGKSDCQIRVRQTIVKVRDSEQSVGSAF